MKLDGFTTVGQFLARNNSELVRLAAEIIGVSCQNHPKCQNAIIDDPKIFDDLFNILKSTQFKDNAKMKAVFALSCMSLIFVFLNNLPDRFKYVIIERRILSFQAQYRITKWVTINSLRWTVTMYS